MPETIQYFNSTGMDPKHLAAQISDLINDGYIFLFDHRGWKYFAFYPDGKPDKS
jgi:hypothetical protein